MKMSNLPSDLVEEILSRVSMTSLRKVRSTCKKWNTLFRDKSFAKKYIDDHAKEEEFMAVMVMDSKVCLMRINLCNEDNVESCIKREGMLISIDDSAQIDISQVLHCDGLLLCITKDKTRLVVWNPYNGQTRWTKPTYWFPAYRECYLYALGYEQKSSNSHRNYKILSYIDYFKVEIYDFNSHSWRVLDDWRDLYFKIDPHIRGVSLKGNTYWLGRPVANNHWEFDVVLVCFDFTRERFGPRLPLPQVKYFSSYKVTAAISSVREEQLAILYQLENQLDMEIWITSKIEPDMVSWNSKVFIEAANMRPPTRFRPQISKIGGCFFVDEEKKVAVVFGKESKDYDDSTRIVAYVIGVDGLLKKIILGESTDQDYLPLACSYAPSLVQLH